MAIILTAMSFGPLRGEWHGTGEIAGRTGPCRMSGGLKPSDIFAHSMKPRWL